MMRKILTEIPASKVFRELLASDPSIDANTLGGMLIDEFPKISPATNTCIHKWLEAEKRSDYPDEQIDEIIRYYLELAGY